MNRLLVPPRSVTGPATDLWDLEKKNSWKIIRVKKKGRSAKSVAASREFIPGRADRPYAFVNRVSKVR